MGCGCGKHGNHIEMEAAGRKVEPTEQCLACALKHYDEACVCLREQGYSRDNRHYVHGSLRAIVLHTGLKYPEIAVAARDCAVKYQDGRGIGREMALLGGMLDDAFASEYPDVRQELPDVVIPLGNGSRNGDMELRMLLRSMEKNLKGYGRAILVTPCCPDWIDRRRVEVLDVPDAYSNNKDANLHRKVLEAIRRYGIRSFVFCADDNAFLSPVEASEIPVLHSHRPLEAFRDGDGIWRKRVWNTVKWAKGIGIDLPHAYECHAPQLFDGQGILEGMNGVDYVAQPGLTIYTTWRAVTGTWKDSVDQRGWKQTLEMPMDDCVLDWGKAFLGYNDATATKVIASLEGVFSEKSIYER